MQTSSAYSPEFLWTRVLDLLRDRVPETAFNTWFTHLSAAEVGEHALCISVPNAFVLEYVEHHYRIILEGAASEAAGRVLAVSFRVMPRAKEIFHPGEIEPEQEVRAETEAAVDAALPLNPRYTFESFVIGGCNQLAHAACVAVAKAPGSNKFNPLILYGGTGMGKTHLLQAIAHFCLENETAQKIVYRTSEEFTREYIEFVQRNKDSRAFYKVYKDADILLLDDIQFLSGKDRTQDEFLNIFSVLHSFHRQIVITSDRPPSQIPGLHARLLSRFDTGLLADLQLPDTETRLAILRKKAEMDGDSCINEDVLSYVASHVTSNVRELEGALIKLSAFAGFSQENITVENAKQILGDILRNHNRRVTIRRITETVAAEFELSVALLTSQTRKKNVSEPRQIAMFLARQLTDNSLHTIGLSFGRDYSTVIHSVKRVELMMENDPKLRSRVEKLQADLS